MAEALSRLSQITLGLLRPNRAWPSDKETIRYCTDRFVAVCIDGVPAGNLKLETVDIRISSKSDDSIVAVCRFYRLPLAWVPRANSLRTRKSTLQLYVQGSPALTVMEASIYVEWPQDHTFSTPLMVCMAEELKDKELHRLCKKYLNTSLR